MADNYWGNTARAALGQGLAMGWGDELEAKIRTMSGDETYEEELAMIADSYDSYAEENPGTALGAEIAGSFIPTIAAYALAPFTGGATAPLAVANTARMANLGNKALKVFNNPLGRSVITGATSGAVSGAGTADEGSRGYGALQGFSFGLGLGTTLPILTRGGGALVTALGDKLRKSGVRVEEGALRRIYEAVRKTGGTPEDVAERLIREQNLGVPTRGAVLGSQDPNSPIFAYEQFMRDQELGVPSRMGNYNSATVNQMDTLASTGAAGDTIEAGLIDVQQDAAERVVAQTNRALGGDNYYDVADELTQDLRTKAKGLYDEAYEYGSVDDQRILNLLENNPRFKQAYEQAKRIAKNEQDADILAGGDGKAYELIPYEIAMEGDKAVGALLPDVRTLDYVKRGLDDIIRRGFDGVGLAPAEAAALRKLRNGFVDTLDEVTEVDGVSAYKTARKMYAGEIEVIDALELGKTKFKSLAPEEITKKFKDMSAAEGEAFIIGVNRHLTDLVNNPSNSANYAQRIIGSKNTRLKLQAMFPDLDDAGMALYEAALLREAQLFKEIGGTLTNSRTAKRLAGQKDLESTDKVLDAVALGVGTLDNSLTTMVANLLKGSTSSADMKKRMAEMLMSDNPEQVAAVVDSLIQFGNKSTVTKKALTGVETALSSAGAQLGDTEQGTSRPEGQRDQLRTSARDKAEAAETPKPEFDANSTELLSMKELYPNNPEVWDIE